jgi:hypothetical protein
VPGGRDGPASGAGAPGRQRHGRVRMLRQGPGKKGKGVGSRVRDRRDQGPGAAGPVIRGLVNGGPQLRRQPRIAAGILGGHPVGEECRSADRLKLVGEEHGPGGGRHVSGVY